MVVLKELILIVSFLEGVVVLKKTEFLQFLLPAGVVVLKEDNLLPALLLG